MQLVTYIDYSIYGNVFFKSHHLISNGQLSNPPQPPQERFETSPAGCHLGGFANARQRVFDR